MKNNLNPNINGYLIIAVKKIRHVEFIELLNYPNENKYDEDIEFYISMIGDEIYEKELNLHKAERIRKIASNYIKYKVFYSLSDENLLESISEQDKYDDGRSFDYVITSFCENIVIEYERLLNEFRKHPISKITTDGYCRKRELNKIIEIHKLSGVELINTL
ncbi:MAG: hypothetical protein KDK36_18710 [Leptospiraceae bacterium]|nr:hypothetical protein [Leptospiraceae bacterium]